MKYNDLEWDDDGGESFKSAISSPLAESFTAYSVCVNPLTLNIDITDHSEFVDALSEGDASLDEVENVEEEEEESSLEEFDASHGNDVGGNEPCAIEDDHAEDHQSTNSTSETEPQSHAVPKDVQAAATNENESKTKTINQKLMANKNLAIKSLTFNQDKDCIALATTNGFQINTLDPDPNQPYQIHKKNIKGGITCIQMLHHSSLLAIVKSKAPRNLYIIHARTGKIVKELSFTSAVRRIEMNKLCLTILTASGDLHVFVYNQRAAVGDRDFVFVKSLNILHSSESARTMTAEGAMLQGAFFELSSHLIEGSAWLVTKSSEGLGYISVYEISLENGTPVMRMENTFHAHSHSIGKIAIGGDDVKTKKLFATASIQGTLIRVYRLSGCEKLYELQRGSSPSTIRSMSFNLNASKISVSSIKGTIHLFDLAEDNQLNRKQNPDGKSSVLNALKRLSLYKSKENEANIIKSFARIRLKGEQSRLSNTIAMLRTTKLENGDEEDNVAICLQDGKLFQYAVNGNGKKRPTRADDLLRQNTPA